jgi:hypothetical protein
LAGVFLRHLAQVDEEVREQVSQAAAETGLVTIKSCFELNEDERAALTQGVNDALGPGVRVEYQVQAAPFGIELKAGSQTVLWTFDDYLDQLENAVGQALARRPAGAVEASTS